MLDLRVFTDVSVNPKSKVGYGAYLILSGGNRFSNTFREAVNTKRFEQTSSTTLELQILLWALREIIKSNAPKNTRLTIYTDSQNIVSLPQRRVSLEQNHYLTLYNKHLNDYKLYQDFFRLTFIIECYFVKVQGHKNATTKDEKDRLFSLVDKASRRALRNEF